MIPTTSAYPRVRSKWSRADKVRGVFRTAVFAAQAREWLLPSIASAAARLAQGSRAQRPRARPPQGVFARTPGPAAFAHRGGAELWPENTLHAFRSAFDMGCPYLETDLRMSRDGEIVLMHDACLERTTNGRGQVCDHSLSELKRLDAGYRFTPDGVTYPFRGGGLQISTLAELVFALPEAHFNVEIKEQGKPNLAEALARFVDRHQIHGRFCVAADNHQYLAHFRRVSCGRVATAASRRECLLFWLLSGWSGEHLLRPRYAALQLPERAYGQPLLRERLLRCARDKGVCVHVWTINEPQRMRALLARGVDGIMTDRPDRLLAAMEGLS